MVLVYVKVIVILEKVILYYVPWVIEKIYYLRESLKYKVQY